ncbi:MAG: metallophosphoesterase [Isosphaeraceae bacterium]
MTLERLALIPVAVGHVSLFVYTMNVTHGLGYSEETMTVTKKLLLAIFGFGAILLGLEFVQASPWSWPVLAYAALCVLTALIVVPLSTAYLHLRPTPEVLDALTDEVELAPSSDRESLIGDGRYAWMLRLPRNESFRLIRREWEITVSGLPTALDGLSLLHFSDLHLAPCFRREYFDRVFDQLATLESDLALFTGDLVDHDDVIDWVSPLFQRVHGRLGSFAILGNHDTKHDAALLRDRVAEAGYTPLDGAWATVSSHGARIALAGTAHPWGPKPDLERRPDADVQILLSHVPDLFYWAVQSDFDLMLSGHNHGGQVRLPVLGPVFMPSLYSRRFDRGFFRRAGLTLHVSQGVAGQHPIRYGCPPEVGRLILRTPLARRPHRHYALESRETIRERASLSGDRRV